MKRDFKVGDLIKYEDSLFPYCVVYKIVEREDNIDELWGVWASSPKEAIKEYKNSPREVDMQYLESDLAILIKEEKKKIKPFGIVKFCKKYYK